MPAGLLPPRPPPPGLGPGLAPEPPGRGPADPPGRGPAEPPGRGPAFPPGRGRGAGRSEPDENGLLATRGVRFAPGLGPGLGFAPAAAGPGRGPAGVGLEPLRVAAGLSPGVDAAAGLAAGVALSSALAAGWLAFDFGSGLALAALAGVGALGLPDLEAAVAGVGPGRGPGFFPADVLSGFADAAGFFAASSSLFLAREVVVGGVPRRAAAAAKGSAGPTPAFSESLSTP